MNAELKEGEYVSLSARFSWQTQEMDTIWHYREEF